MSHYKNLSIGVSYCAFKSYSDHSMEMNFGSNTSTLVQQLVNCCTNTCKKY